MLRDLLSDCILSTEEGRTIYENVKRRTRYSTSNSSCNITTPPLSTTPFLTPPPPPPPPLRSDIFPPLSRTLFESPTSTPSLLLRPPSMIYREKENLNSVSAIAARVITPRNNNTAPNDSRLDRALTTIKKRNANSTTTTKKNIPSPKKKRTTTKQSLRSIRTGGKNPCQMSGKKGPSSAAGGKGGNTSPSGDSLQTTDDSSPSASPKQQAPNKVSPSRAQNDIRKLLHALSEYAYSSSSNKYNDDNNNSVGENPSRSATAGRTAIPEDVGDVASSEHTLPPLTAQIPKTLIGFVGTHCEVDAMAVSEAAQGITSFCAATGTEKRLVLLREEFRRVLRTGGIEIVLQGIARMAHKKKAGASTSSANSSANASDAATTVSDSSGSTHANNSCNEQEAKAEAVFHCWGVLRTGIASGLSKNTLVLVVRSCILGMNELETAWNETSTASTAAESGTTGTPSGSSSSGQHRIFETLAKILDVLLQAIASPRINADDLYYDQTTILASCLALLGQACCCSDGDDCRHTEAKIIGLIEDLLGILVLCARKGLIRGHDFQRLVPACQASLSRFQLATAGTTGSDNEDTDASTSAGTGANNTTIPDIGKTIVVRVVELIELEDKTVGLWLRHTYGLSEDPRQQEQQSQQQQQGQPQPRDDSWRSAAEAAYERAASTIGNAAASNNNNSRGEDDNPSPPHQRELFPSIAVGPPESFRNNNNAGFGLGIGLGLGGIDHDILNDDDYLSDEVSDY